MKTKKLSYENNVFMVLKNRSMKRFYKVLYSFMAALYAEHLIPEINAIHTSLQTPCTAFMDAFLNWRSQQGVRKGDTVTQNYLFDALYQIKMPDWHRRIQVVYAPGTGEYKKIFPDGLSPFSQKSLEERLIYLNLVIKNASFYASLNIITGEMTTFRDDIKNIRLTQQNSVSVVKVTSAELKHIAENMAIEMYGALGSLMTFHKQHPPNIRKYFILSLLHYYKKPDGEPADLYEVILEGGETKEAGFAFTIDEKLMLYNSGETKLRIWFVADIHDTMPATFIDLDEDAVVDFTINQYANQGDRFMMLKNLSDTTAGSVEIEKI
jgi:hypothetical protein